jgi:hypothetical protein
VRHQAITKPLGKPFLKIFEFLFKKLDHFAGSHIYQMIMMVLASFLVSGAAIVELVTLNNSGFGKQTKCAVSGREGDMGVNRGGTAVNLFDIGMIDGPLPALARLCDAAQSSSNPFRGIFSR